MSHTPGPWKANETPHSNNQDWVVLDSGANGHSRRVCAVYSDNAEADAHLIAAAPELLEAQTMGAELNTPDFLDWIAARLIHYGDNPNADFILSLRERAKSGRAAIAKAEGK